MSAALTTSLAARRRPVALVAVYVVEALVAWVLASPWVEAISAVMGQHPEGDRALWWQRGHLLLVDVVMRNGPMLGAILRGTFVALAAWFVVSLLPLGALLAALSDEERFSFRRACARAGELFGRLTLIQLVSAMTGAATLGLVGIIPAVILKNQTAGLMPRTAFVVTLLPLVVAFFALLFLWAFFDLTRALVARHDVTAMRACFLAARAPRAVLALMAVATPRWVASLGMIGFGAAAASGTSSIALIALAHQAAAFGRVALRASVLARALRLSDSVIDALPGTR
jgi:hypothetical protein